MFICSGSEQALSTQSFHLLVNNSSHLLERETHPLLHPLHFPHQHKELPLCTEQPLSTCQCTTPGVYWITANEKRRAEGARGDGDIVHMRDPEKVLWSFFFSCHGPGLAELHGEAQHGGERAGSKLREKPETGRGANVRGKPGHWCCLERKGPRQLSMILTSPISLVPLWRVFKPQQAEDVS